MSFESILFRRVPIAAVLAAALTAVGCTSLFHSEFPNSDGSNLDGGGTSGIPKDWDGGHIGGFVLNPPACASVTLEQDVNLDGYHVDRYSWSDGACLKRTAALVRNNASDPGGSKGGFLREIHWTSKGAAHVGKGTGANGWNGFGYLVNHTGSDGDTNLSHTGTFQTVLAGPHHAIHEFKVRLNLGGPVDATVHWFFATGKTHPIFSVSYDSTPSGSNVANADSRSPYGDLAFEGTPGDIGGIGWGDKYRFTTTGLGPVTFASTWDYTQANVVPYVRMWAQNVDAEMGLVQTESFDQHMAGGDYGAGTLGAFCWGKTSANKGASCATSGQTMPTDWLWPYQLNQYELPFTTGSHRLAWGMTFGAVGQTSVSAFGRTFSGYPETHYSVFVVLGEHSNAATLAQESVVESAIKATSSATYNPVYASWDSAFGSDPVDFDSKGASIAFPIFRFTDFTAAQISSVKVNGETLAANSGYFATLDAATHTLWLTLAGTVTGPIALQVN